MEYEVIETFAVEFAENLLLRDSLCLVLSIMMEQTLTTLMRKRKKGMNIERKIWKI